LATSGDLDLATNGDFFMAMDNLVDVGRERRVFATFLLVAGNFSGR
jgi:hypothetical protein